MMLSKFVVMDLETTGVSPAEGDQIIQIAYVVIDNGEKIKSFSSFISGAAYIPEFVQQLTGISLEDLEGAPAFEDVVPEVLTDLSNACFVAHNADFDLPFLNEALEEAGYTSFEGPVADTVELSRIFFPSEDSFRLGELSASLGISHDNPHQADSDAEAAADLWLRIHNKLQQLPAAALKHLLSLSTSWKSDMYPIVAEAYETASGADEAESETETYRGIAVRKPAKAPRRNRTEPVQLKEVLATFQQQETMEAIFPGYIYRSGQADMMTFTDTIFSENETGLAEAGTGTGKTLAYLIPAAVHAWNNKERIVISTETIQLQEQILKKEIPLLEKLLPFRPKTALLKGRHHYACLQKVERLLENQLHESYETMLARSQLLIWLTETTTGDLEELNLAAASQLFMKEIASDPESCSSPDCPWFSRDYYQRAKQQAREADLVITNHALLLTDIAHDTQVIPAYRKAVIDEAHHLSEAASRQFGISLEYADMARLLNEFAGRDRDQKGLLERALEHLPAQLSRLTTAFEDAKQEYHDTFLMMYQYLSHGAGTSESGGRARTVHMDRRWAQVQDTAARFRAVMQDILDEWVFLQQEASEKDLPKLTAFFQELEDKLHLVEKLILQQQDGYVYWLEKSAKGPKQSITVYSSPTEVDHLLADRFFRKKKSVLLTSATMTVDKSFAYMIDELGLEDFEIRTLQVASPFRWKEQAAILIPEDMPHIKDDGEELYIEALVETVYRLSSVTKGKMMVLFTSYDMLRRAYRLLQPMLDESYLLIGQGVQSKSRTKLVKMFQQFDRSILFGTSSFWEGVDIPGDDLSVLVMARLPFPPPGDPVFQAKADKLKESGGSPFMKLSLPKAVLRFKQGFGRLIRNEKDSGLIVVMDRRIITARYGRKFLKSLPEDVAVYEESIYDLENRAEAWFRKELQE
ncbi:ATP-dependent DNA helicase DinG [Bacillus daqingensis]|uniref:3'-5' exonuclease DinG n=1 Tax=Bacillus daqingensis TaxID=872396 RepID=A0ABV9NVC4_9BACI